jgi:hypothetical protein
VEIKVTVQVTNDGRTLSNPLEFTYVSGIISIPFLKLLAFLCTFVQQGNMIEYADPCLYISTNQTTLWCKVSSQFCLFIVCIAEDWFVSKG